MVIFVKPTYRGKHTILNNFSHHMNSYGLKGQPFSIHDLVNIEGFATLISEPQPHPKTDVLVPQCNASNS